MGHYGRHIVDPETGLCEICDRGAIHEFRQGKRSGKQFLYSNQDGRFTYRPADDQTRHYSDHTTPRYVHRPAYSEPPPVRRTRPIVKDEPAVIQKKVPRRLHSPVDDIHHPQPSGRSTTTYYVDSTGQMFPRNEGPPDEPRQRYVVQNHQPASTHSTRAVQRRARTPPPPASEPLRSRPKRQINSDTEIIHETNRAKPNDYHYNQSPRKVEMYYIQAPPDDNRYPTLNSLVQTSHDHHNPPSKTHYQGDTNRKQRQLEPMDRTYYPEPEPTVVRKVYKKLPANKNEYPEDKPIPNGYHLQPVRKVEKVYASPRSYASTPRLTNLHVESPLSSKHPATYYIRPADEY